jgi:hypothetical protein
MCIVEGESTSTRRRASLALIALSAMYGSTITSGRRMLRGPVSRAKRPPITE